MFEKCIFSFSIYFITAASNRWANRDCDILNMRSERFHSLNDFLGNLFNSPLPSSMRNANHMCYRIRVEYRDTVCCEYREDNPPFSRNQSIAVRNENHWHAYVFNNFYVYSMALLGNDDRGILRSHRLKDRFDCLNVSTITISFCTKAMCDILKDCCSNQIGY